MPMNLSRPPTNKCTLAVGGQDRRPRRSVPMPRSHKPNLIEERNQHVASIAQHVQALLWTASPDQRDELRRRWPELADALKDLDEELERPVVSRGLWDPTS